MLATTESPLDRLEQHAAIRASGWAGRVITAYRPDPVVDPEFAGFAANLARFSELTAKCEALRAEKDAAEERWLELAMLVEEMAG